jgi:hypothetical protein
MKLYVVFNTDLLDTLQSSCHGAQLSGAGLKLSCPAYADDISMVAIHQSSIQAMINIAHRHSCKWRYTFNHTKSHVLVFGKEP